MLPTKPNTYAFTDLPRDLQRAIDARIAKFDLAADGARRYRQYRADRFAWLDWAQAHRPQLVEVRREYLERCSAGVEMAMVDWVQRGQLEMFG